MISLEKLLDKKKKLYNASDLQHFKYAHCSIHIIKIPKLINYYKPLFLISKKVINNTTTMLY